RPDVRAGRRLPGAGAAQRPRTGAHHRHVQPEGRRRQDDDDDQPRRRAGRVRPPGPHRRLRPAGRGLRRSRHQRQRARPDDLLGAHGAPLGRPGDHPRDGRRGAGHRPGEHRPLRRGGHPRHRGGPPARAQPRAAPRDRRPRPPPRRLPAAPRTARRRVEHALSRVLRPVTDDYDLILVDCQPSLGLLAVNALTAAHGVMIPLEAEFFALRGVALLMETIDKVSERINPRLQLDGILVTMYDGRTLHAREVLERVREGFGDRVFDTVINRTIKFPDATIATEPITSYAPTHAGAEAYRRLARELVARGDVA